MDAASKPFLSKHDLGDTYMDSEKFQDLDIESTEGQEQNHRARRRYAWWELLALVFAAWGVASLCLEAIRATSHFRGTPVPDVYRPKTLKPGLNLCDCGNTAEEALARDCVYDTLATAWLPPHCRDDDLTAEFEKSGPGLNGEWPYWADEFGTVPLSRTEMGLLGEKDGTFWSSHDWHLTHCMFYWQKYFRMKDTGAVMEARFDTLKHIKHCTKMLLEPRPQHYFLLEVPVMMNSSDDIERPTRVSGQLPWPVHYNAGQRQ